MAAPTDPSPPWRQTVLATSYSRCGDRPCSTKSNRPPGLRTRLISVSAATGSAIEHNVQVITTVSKAVMANGSCSADARSSDTGKSVPFTRFQANPSSSGDGSMHIYNRRLGHRAGSSSPTRHLSPNRPSAHDSGPVEDSASSYRADGAISACHRHPYCDGSALFRDARKAVGRKNFNQRAPGFPTRFALTHGFGQNPLHRL